MLCVTIRALKRCCSCTPRALSMRGCTASSHVCAHLLPWTAGTSAVSKARLPAAAPHERLSLRLCLGLVQPSSCGFAAEPGSERENPLNVAHLSLPWVRSPSQPYMARLPSLGWRFCRHHTTQLWLTHSYGVQNALLKRRHRLPELTSQLNIFKSLRLPWQLFRKDLAFGTERGAIISRNLEEPQQGSGVMSVEKWHERDEVLILNISSERLM